MQNKNENKDLDKVLAALDPRLREKIMSSPKLQQQKEPNKSEKPGTASQESVNVSSAAGTAAVGITNDNVQSEKEKPDELSEASEESTGTDTELSSETEPEIREPVNQSLKEAEDKAAAILSFEPSSAKSAKKTDGGINVGMEILILEVIALLFFFLCMRSGLDGLALIAVLMPAIYGILSRMLFHQLTLIEAVSKSKLHIFMTAVLLIAIIASV